MGHKTRKKDKIKKIIADIPEDLHKQFKTICEDEGIAMKTVIEWTITNIVNKEISIDSLISDVVQDSLHVD